MWGLQWGKKRKYWALVADHEAALKKMPGFFIAKTVCRCHCKVSRKFEAAACLGGYWASGFTINSIQFNSMQSDIGSYSIRFGFGSPCWVLVFGCGLKGSAPLYYSYWTWLIFNVSNLSLSCSKNIYMCCVYIFSEFPTFILFLSYIFIRLSACFALTCNLLILSLIILIRNCS